MMEALLSLKIPANWMSLISKKYPISISVLDRKPYAKHGVCDLVEIRGAQKDLERVIEEIGAAPGVHSADIALSGKNRAVGTVSTKCFACRALTGSECFLTKAGSRKDGSIEWRLVFNRNGDLNKLIERLKTFGVDVDIIKITRKEDKKDLTDRQEELVALAFEKGYFEYPRKITLSRLASNLGLSKSTLAEILRRGQEKIITDYMKKKF